MHQTYPLSDTALKSNFLRRSTTPDVLSAKAGGPQSLVFYLI